MVIRRPVVSISGLNSQLPDGDTIEGGSLGDLIAGSGIVEGSNADLSLAVDVSVSLAPNPSGVIFVDNKYLGDDGVAQTLASLAVVSGIYATEISVEALASGAAAVTLVNTALASGTAAATDIENTPGGAAGEYVAATDLLAGYPVGLNQQNQVEAIRYEEALSPYPNYQSNTYPHTDGLGAYYDACWNSSNNYYYVVWRGTNAQGNYGYFALIQVQSDSTLPQTVSYAAYTTVIASYNIIAQVPGTTYAFVAFQDETTVPSGSRVVICYESNGFASFGGPSPLISPFFSRPQCFAYDNDIGDMLLVIDERDSNSSVYGLKYNFNEHTNQTITNISSPVTITSGVSNAAPNNCAVNYITESGTYQGNGYYIFAYADSDNSYYGTARIYLRTGSQTTMQANSKYVFSSTSTRFIHMASESGVKGVITYSALGTTGYAYAVTWSRGTLVSTGIAFSTPVVINDGFMPSAYRTLIDYFIAGDCYIITDQRQDASANYQNMSAFLTVDTANNNLPVLGPFVTGTYGWSPSQTNYLASATRQTEGGQSYFIADYPQLGQPLNTATQPLIETKIFPEKSTVQSSSYYVNNFLGIAKTPVASGSVVEVGLQTTVQPVYSGLQPCFFYYLDPTTSGISTNSSTDRAWRGYSGWKPVGRALSSTELLVTSDL